MSKNQNEIRTLLLRASTGSLAVMVAGAGFSFVSNMLFARLLGVADYGFYIYALTWISILSIIVSMGMDTSLLRFVPAYIEHAEWGLLRGILKYSTQIIVISGAVTAALACLVIIALGVNGFKIHTASFLIGSLLLPLIGLARFNQSVLRSLRFPVKASLPENVIRPLFLLSVVILSYTLTTLDLNAKNLMVMNVAAALAALILGAWWIFHALPHEIKTAEPAYRKSDWLKFSLPMLLISSMQLLLQQIDIVMLGIMTSTEQSGIYSVASRISALAVFGLSAANMLIAPMISQYYTRGDHDSLQKMITLSAQGIFLFTILITFILWLTGPYLLSLFGKEFSSGYASMNILLIGQLINALSGSVGFLMTMTKHHIAAAWILAADVIINIGLNYLLIPIYGIEGAAFATTITMAIWNIIMVGYVINALGINPTAISRRNFI